jgi:glycosyltransferase involved in cell wall biosynthesis
MNVILVDASLYTAPYDGALTRGLLAAGVRPTWMTRPVRRGDRHEIPPQYTDPFFYRRVDEADSVLSMLRPIVKGCAHFAGIARLLWKIRRVKPDLVHLQWVVVPLIDIAAMVLIRRWCPLILTVHDSVPYNGEKTSLLRRLGRKVALKLAHRVIVHTHSGRQTLLRHGAPGERICVIPHGPLSLPVTAAAPAPRDPRWTMVLFGEIKPYKGLDILIEAVAALPLTARRNLRVVVAGRLRMHMTPLVSRIAALGLHEQFELRLRRLSEEEIAVLFAEADGFVFPYLQIDASGVYHLVNCLGKWLIASRVGVFAEAMSAEEGTLVPPGDVPALARALEDAIARRPLGSVRPPATSWYDIGCATRALYEQARTEFDARRAGRPAGAWQR